MGLSAEQADERGGDGHAGGRAILGDRAGRHVDVQVGLAEARGIQVSTLALLRR